MKIKLMMIFMFCFVALFAQKRSCEGPKEEDMLDLNSITKTKCTLNSTKEKGAKNTRQIKVRVSASRARYLKRKQAPSKRNSAKSLGGLSTASIADKSTLIKNDMLSITNTLSKEELRNAHKFAFVDKIPTFKKCKSLKGSERLDCFNTEMISHINNHFSYPSQAVIDRVQGEVWVRFVIDSNGNVTNIKAMGPDGAVVLDQEATRVVSKLPAFVPGEVSGKPVAVKYGFPINFSLEQ